MFVTPMAYSTANWHWKNKVVMPWAKEWFKHKLIIQVEGSPGPVVSVEQVVSVNHDIEIRHSCTGGQKRLPIGLESNYILSGSLNS